MVEIKAEEKNLLMSHSNFIPDDTHSIKYFLSQPEIRVNLIVMAVGWFASSFDYYMISFSLKYFPGNVFLNCAVSSLSEAVACVLAGAIYDRLGVRMAFVVTYAIAVLGGAASLSTRR